MKRWKLTCVFEHNPIKAAHTNAHVLNQFVPQAEEGVICLPLKVAKTERQGLTGQLLTWLNPG